jgi:hypothetical protein
LHQETTVKSAISDLESHQQLILALKLEFEKSYLAFFAQIYWTTAKHFQIAPEGEAKATQNSQ